MTAFFRYVLAALLVGATALVASASQNLGDYAEDYATLNFSFTTQNPSTGVPFVLAGTPEVSVYRGSETVTEKGSIAESYITLAVDFDGVVGLNNVLIDLSGDIFFAVGNEYKVVITTGTVNGVSVVGTVVAHFSIEGRSAPSRIVIKAEIDQALVDIQLDHLLQTSDIGTTTNDSIIAKMVAAGTPAVFATFDNTTYSLENIGATVINVDSLLEDLTDVMGTRAEAASTGDPDTSTTATEYLKQIVNILEGSDGISTMKTEAAPADGVSLSEMIVAIYNDTATTLDAKLNDIQGATFDTADDSLEAIRDRGDAAWITGDTTPDTRDLLPVQFVWQLPSRAGGGTTSKNKLNVTQGEAIRAGFDCSPVRGLQLNKGTVLASMTTPTLVTPSSDVTLTELGVDARFAKVLVTVDASATPGTHWVTTSVTTSAGGTVTLFGRVVVVAGP